MKSDKHVFFYFFILSVLDETIFIHLGLQICRSLSTSKTWDIKDGANPCLPYSLFLIAWKP